MVKILLLLLRGRDADRSAIIGWWESSTCTRYDYRSRFEDRLIASSVDEELVVESREPRACRNHVSSPARKNTWWFHAIPLLEVGPPSSLLLFSPSLSLVSCAMYPINFYRYPPSPLERKFAVSIVSRSFDDRFFIFFWKDATGGWVRKRWKRRRWTRGGEDGGGGGWNCENRHAHARDRTHVRTTRHAAEHYGFRRPISTSRTDETRRKQPIARPRPDRKENPSRLIPRFRKRWRDSTLTFLLSSSGGGDKRVDKKVKAFVANLRDFFPSIYWSLWLIIIVSLIKYL